ncbi:dipeptide ABC transporter ATP-binding protein [Nesterenkonia muleiensis]|uniref:dipeptide ABC transporter ATP-binding protein n=1 Tax=Nesterenkonia muleiensis TaxID=2282648 RepID=UPI000E737897|nr:ABC transporter ATP-binding protein [Nesterenkonia muleiensis]
MPTQIITEELPGAKSQRLLDIRDLRVAYNNVEALHDVSLDVMAGETVAIVGESGSGKSTTAQAIISLLTRGGKVTGGEILFAGTDLTTVSTKEMRGIRGRSIGLIPQDPMLSLNAVKRITDQVSEVLRIHTPLNAKQRHERVVELLADAGLRDPEIVAGQYPFQLSGGMRQRVLIASAIACNPRLIIADEPTSALDVTVQRQILDRIERVSAEHGAAVILITHDLGVAADRANRIVVMNKGEVVERGSARQILTQPQADYTKRLVAAAPSMKSLSLIDHDEDEAGISPPEPLVSVQGLRKTFQRPGGEPLTAVDDMSFAIPAGKTLAIVGESGSGKSTTARMMVRLEDIDEGVIRLGGEVISAVSGAKLRRMRKRFQMVYQDPFGSLNPRWTIGGILEEPLRLHNIVPRSQRRARVRELLELVSLPASFEFRRPRQLSGGQRQRVAIARALSVEPELVVCDEPVSALDVSVQAQILELLVRLQEERGLTYLFISHDLAVVRQIAHNVIIMQKGQVVERGNTSEIFDNPREEYTKELLAAIPGSRIEQETLPHF